MSGRQFGITEDGVVFSLGRGFRKLGHIAHLTTARTPIAQEFQQWWREQLESDGPIENIVEVQDRGNGRRQYRVRTRTENVVSTIEEMCEPGDASIAA